METTAAAVTVGVTRQKLTFKYDYLGRRMLKGRESGWNGTSYATTDYWNRYLYVGWNVAVEVDANINFGTITKSVFWGLDLSGTIGGAGGIGGLLMVQEGGNSYLPAYDALGNIHAMIKASDGTLAATYEYDAFGQTLRESGPYAADNPFRFATKFADVETGLVQYNTRYYSPSLGRFINRDTISEQGGLNLYAYCGNNGVNRWDMLGMVENRSAGGGGSSQGGGGGGFWEWLTGLFGGGGGGGSTPAGPPADRRSSPAPAVQTDWTITLPKMVTNSPDSPAAKKADSSSPGGQLNFGDQFAQSYDRYSNQSRMDNAPNSTARDDLIRQAGVITRRMNDTLSDLNVVEGNIRLGEAVSTAHMVVSEGFEAGAVIGKGAGVLKNVFTLGGYLTRGAGTLGVGGRVITGMPGTAAGDLVNASIRGQQVIATGGAVLMETGETLFGAGIIKGTGALINEFGDATNSGQGAVGAAYGAAAMIERSYWQDAARLKAIRQEITRLGPPGGG